MFRDTRNDTIRIVAKDDRTTPITEEEMIKAYKTLKDMKIPVKNRKYDDVAMDVLKLIGYDEFPHVDWFKDKIYINNVPLTMLHNHRNSKPNKVEGVYNDLTQIDVEMNGDTYVWRANDNGAKFYIEIDTKTRTVKTEGAVPMSMLDTAMKVAKFF